MSPPISNLTTESKPASDELAAARRHIDRCEALLEQSEARFRNAIELNSDAIVAVGEDGTVRYANAMAGRTFGTDPARLVGTPFGLPLISGAVTELDVIVNGAPRLTEMRVTESTWDDSPVRLAFLRDITHLETLRQARAAQAATRLAEARLREIVGQAPVAIAVLRGAEHRYEITNTRYQELIGHRDVIGKTVREALPELEGQGIYELFDQVFRTGEPYVGSELSLMIERHPGKIEETFFSFVYQPLCERDGTVSAIAIVATDVTVQVRARTDAECINAELQQQTHQLEQQASELEKANKAKAEFLATMSHELRTPLNAIGGYADLILAEIRGPITEAQRIDLGRINRSQRHLLSVINDILNFAKVEAGHVELNVADVAMNEVLGELESLVAPTLIEKRIAYEYRCCDSGFRALADVERLQQILLNLLSNAAKFTPPGGRITVECGATETQMVVRVSDTGVGIDADKLERVFEPFVQLEHGKAPGMGGTGLGLSISRDLARLMGGDLTAASIPQQGATFTLRMPRALSAADGLASGTSDQCQR